MSKQPQYVNIAPNVCIHNYQFLKQLGKGNFGIVYQALNLQDQNLVAVKCIPMSLKQSSYKAFQLFQAEVQILQKIKNVNVVGYRDYFVEKNACFLVQEFCNGGDLENLIKSQPNCRFSVDQSIIYFKQMLNAFKSLHEHNIVHRDLKLANILVNDEILKLADFGFAKELQSENDLIKTMLGTPLTMAPEILQQQPYHMDTDIYSLGVNFYFLVYGKYPFDAGSEFQLLQKIKNQQINFKQTGVQYNLELVDLLSRMLKFDPKSRIKWTEIYAHPLFVEKVSMQQIGQEINIQRLNQSKVKIDMNQNLQFYKNQKVNNIPQHANQFFQPEQQNTMMNFEQMNNNMVNKQANQIPEQQYNYQQIYQPQQFNQVNEEKAKIIMNQFEAKQKEKEQIKQIVELYLQEINVYKQIIKAVITLHNLPETQINTFYCGFFLLKKARTMIKSIIQTLEDKLNIFEQQLFPQFLQSEECKQILDKLKQDIDMIENYYQARLFDIQDLMGQTPDPNIIKEIGDDVSPTFDIQYKIVLMDYYSNLNNEVNRHLMAKNEKGAFIFQKHIIEILDSYDVEKMFKLNIPQLNVGFIKNYSFLFDQYQQFKDSLTPDQIQPYIQKKLDYYFANKK